MNSDCILLAHGNGGRLTRELIDEVFVKNLKQPKLDTLNDSARLVLPNKNIFMTTDNFTVQPLEFPGGNIGSLAIHGTVNDLMVSGARPLYLSASFIIEEGLTRDCLIRIVKAMADAARHANVEIVTGDTKVVPKGHGGGVYINTTGVGMLKEGCRLDVSRIAAGDHIIVSGPLGDHGIAVLLARDEFGLESELHSDSASVCSLADAIDDLDGVKFMRDPTRGGLVMVMHEIAHAASLCARLVESSIPFRDEVESVCSILGYDPYYLASEGRIVAVVSPDQSQEVVKRWKECELGKGAAIIGEMLPYRPTQICPISLRTIIGGERFLDQLVDDPLPRIC